MHNIKFRYTKHKKHTKTKKHTKNKISIGGFQQSQLPSSSPISNQQQILNMIYKLLQKQKLLQTQQAQQRQFKKKEYNFKSKNSLAVRGQLTGTM